MLLFVPPRRAATAPWWSLLLELAVGWALLAAGWAFVPPPSSRTMRPFGLGLKPPRPPPPPPGLLQQQPPPLVIVAAARRRTAHDGNGGSEQEYDGGEEEEEELLDPVAPGSSFPMDPPEAAAGPAGRPAAAAADGGTTTPWDNFVEIFVGPEPRPPEAEGEGEGERAAAAVDGEDEGDGDGEGAASARYFLRTDVPYYFLRDELGLGEARMLRVSLDHGQVLALSVARSLRPKVAWLREALQLSRAEAAQLVGASPGVLLLSVEDNLMPKLRWFKEELALSDADRRRLIRRCPQLLTASTGALLLKLAFLKDDVGLSAPDLARAIRTMPQLLVLSLDTLVDKAEYLTHGLGMTMKNVGFLLVRSPALFFQALDTGLKPKVRFLRRDLGLSNDQIRALVLKAPRLLNYRVAARGRALLAYLTRPPFDMAQEEAVRLVLKFPTLLGTDVGGMRFQETVQALKAATGSGTERVLAGVVQRFPGALQLTAGRIRRAQAVLAGPPLHCSPEEAAEVLRKHPQALAYRPEAIVAKLEAVAAAYGEGGDGGAVATAATGTTATAARGREGKGKGKGKGMNIKAALLKAPALLSYSLEGRLRPRLAAAAAAGVAMERAVTMLSLPDGRFEERLDRSAAGPLPELPPLLRQRANARLRKVLVAQQKRRQGLVEGEGEGEGGKPAKGMRKRAPKQATTATAEAAADGSEDEGGAD